MADRDPYQSALDQLSAFGLVVESLQTDGKLHRVKTDSDKGSKKSGWYVAHEFILKSGRVVITGRFGNWKSSAEPQAFRFDAQFTDEEKVAFKLQQEDQRKAAAKEKRERNKQAAARAEKAWEKLPTDGHSDYLQRKKIYGYGCRYSRGSIAVPVKKAGKLTGLQWIAPDGSKKFITGTEKQGAVFWINEGQSGPVILCEGYATGCSIAMAMPKAAVAVCFDAGNLQTVAHDAVGELGLEVIIAADNDHQAKNNKGLQVAAELIRRYPEKIRAVWPEFSPDDPGTDFNDLHVGQGLEAVKAAFDASAPQAFPRDLVNQNAGADEPPPAPPEAAQAGEPTPDPGWLANLKRGGADGDGTVRPLSSNIELILTHDPRWRGSLAYCDFSYRIIKRRADISDMVAGEWEDADTARLAIWLSNTYGFEPARAKITDAIIVAAQRRRFHPVREYLDSLTWDQVPRIDQWLQDIFEASAEQTEYLQAAGAKFLIGAVARIYKPGCKMDNVLILEGYQGMKKSSSMEILFGEWFSDAPIPIGEKDAYQNIQGIWCSELAELDSFNKAESTSAKQFFSQRRDRYRPSYGQHAQDYPRQTIFVGTTNQGEYLKDYTGNRRYWPVKCNVARLDLLIANRDQLWAEAVHRYRSGDTWWPDDATRSIFEAEQDQRMQIDPWQYRIESYLRSLTVEDVTSWDVLTEAIGKETGQITKADQTRLSPIMQKLGWKNVRKRIKVDGKTRQRHVYVKDPDINWGDSA